ncbi:hypothetical protein KAZ01_01045 [Candidatus Gracilibacteria bacterium]|jgi:hypothetical protein|nr:hypothetical protein [Candidatus Gracilibacteria bacterium]
MEFIQESTISKIFDSILRKQEEVYIQALRMNAVPPIKGKITKGKLKWRGIKHVTYYNNLVHEEWLEQRGKQISDKIIIEISLPEI